MGYVTFTQFCNSSFKWSLSPFFNPEIRLVVISKRPWILYTLENAQEHFWDYIPIIIADTKKLKKCLLFLWQFRGQLPIFIQVDMIPPDRGNLQLTRNRNLICPTPQRCACWATAPFLVAPLLFYLFACDAKGVTVPGNPHKVSFLHLLYPIYARFVSFTPWCCSFPLFLRCQHRMQYQEKDFVSPAVIPVHRES